MIELYYDPFGIACFVVSREMGIRTQMEFLEKLFGQDYEYIHPEYKSHKKDFITDVLYWSDYLADKENLDQEFPLVERDLKAVGKQLVFGEPISEYPELDYFFMFLRLRIRYSDGQDYARMKLRTLLKRYGYKRRSPLLTTHIRECMLFYHIQSYLRGQEECDIRKINLDDMITFRVL